jgi:hypothetical protein
MVTILLALACNSTIETDVEPGTFEDELGVERSLLVNCVGTQETEGETTRSHYDGNGYLSHQDYKDAGEWVTSAEYETELDDLERPALSRESYFDDRITDVTTYDGDSWGPLRVDVTQEQVGDDETHEYAWIYDWTDDGYVVSAEDPEDSDCEDIYVLGEGLRPAVREYWCTGDLWFTDEFEYRDDRLWRWASFDETSANEVFYTYDTTGRLAEARVDYYRDGKDMESSSSTTSWLCP